MNTKCSASLAESLSLFAHQNDKVIPRTTKRREFHAIKVEVSDYVLHCASRLLLMHLSLPWVRLGSGSCVMEQDCIVTVTH